MTRVLQSLAEVAAGYDAIVLDQWGVLHDGSTPYPGAVDALVKLKQDGHRLAVLSNSGKRAAPNADRICATGYPRDLFETVMTSGEALWLDVKAGHIPEERFFAIERTPGDANIWSAGLRVSLCESLAQANAILLMGLPDGSMAEEWQVVLNKASARDLPLYCSNPDRASPRAGGAIVVSPGEIAHRYHDQGGKTVFYGKPHLPIFTALETFLGTSRVLMIGDSLEHDIAGAHAAGWDTVFVTGGLYARSFSTGPDVGVIDRLCAEKAAPAPTYSLEVLR